MRSRILFSAAAIASVGALLVGCTSTSDEPTADEAIIIGTTDVLTALDPAGTWDRGSAMLQNQVFSWLLTSEPGSTEPVPDLAETAEFTSDTEYTVTLRDGITFANGHELTATDVKFSFDRMRNIADPNGPSSLLADLVSVDTPDELTVVFTLATPNNELWPQLLTSPAGIIVDEEVFSPVALTPDDDIVAGQAFAGPFSIVSYERNALVELAPRSDYTGLLGVAKSPVVLRYYTDEANLQLDIEGGAVQVAYRTLGPTAIASLRENDGVKIYSGPGAELRFFTFDPEIAPFGTETADADSAKAQAVREAIAHLIDRAELSEQVYKGTYLPLYTIVPDGVPGSVPAYQERYGDGEGGPDADAARAVLEAAGVDVPVALHLQYNPDHYGASSADEYALIKDQLDRSGLFETELQSTEWSQYVTEIGTSYPVYQLGWFADYPDADNYLNMLYSTDESPSLLGASVRDDDYNALVEAERTLADGDERTAEITAAQRLAAERLVTVPLLESAETVVARTEVQGIDGTLDSAGRFRFGLLSIG